MNLKFTGEELRFWRERKIKYILGIGHQCQQLHHETLKETRQVLSS